MKKKNIYIWKKRANVSFTIEYNSILLVEERYNNGMILETMV